LNKTPIRRLGKRQAFIEWVGVTTWTGAFNYAAESNYLAKSTDPGFYDGIDAIHGLEDGLRRIKDDLAKMGLAIHGTDLDRAYTAYCTQLASYLDTLARAHTVDSWQRRESLRIADLADAIAPGGDTAGVRAGQGQTSAPTERRVRDATPLRRQHADLAQLRHDLLRLVVLSRHVSPPRQNNISGWAASSGVNQ